MEKEKTEEEKKVFNPRMELFSAFEEPFAAPSMEVISDAIKATAACCACTACIACRQ